MVEKRPAEENGDSGPSGKRVKTDNDKVVSPAAGLINPGAKEALEKAKKLLQAQKKLQEKLKNLPQVAPKLTPSPANPSLAPLVSPVGPPIGLPAVPLPFTILPQVSKTVQAPPLRLDAQGREIDHLGNVIQTPIQVVTTLKVNQNMLQAQREQKVLEEQAAKEAPPAPVAESPFFDPRVGAKAARKLDRRRRSGFDFVEEGAFQRQAEIMRLKASFGENIFKKVAQRNMPSGQVPKTGGELDPNKIPLGVPRREAAEPEVEQVPEVEWWDRVILLHSSFAANELQGLDPLTVKETKITHYIEHPVPIEPPAEGPPPPPQPLKLTPKELKKLRTQRRQAREKEKQELIRQGLLEPPKPKVRLANMMRVLGAEATADPTAIEAEVKKQMAERQQAHDDRNLSRKLTKSEKREKKLKKMFDDQDLEQYTVVYKVMDLSNKQHRWKVETNARENHMTGRVLVGDEFTLVIAEGCNKAVKRYNKLMLRRIDWNASADLIEEDIEKPPNACYLVWQGTVRDSVFDDFKLVECSSAPVAKQVLTEIGVGHYWDAAEQFNPEDEPIVAL